MTSEREQELVLKIRKYITENLPLAQMGNEELQERVEKLVGEYLGTEYCSIQQRVSIAEQVYGAIRGFGLLDSILHDDTITEVMINGPENIFIEQKGRLRRLERQFESERNLEDIIQRIVGLAGREVNQASPICDTRLPDGSRVNVVLPPISLCGPILTIRKFSKTPMTIERLISYGSITQEIADVLDRLVRAKYNIFICGGTGSGKTTFLNAVSNYIPKDERVITIEDSAELQIEGIENLVSLETRNANASGNLSGIDHFKWTYEKEDGASAVNMPEKTGTIPKAEIQYSADGHATAGFSLTASEYEQYRGSIAVVATDRAGNSSGRKDDGKIQIVILLHRMRRQIMKRICLPWIRRLRKTLRCVTVRACWRKFWRVSHSVSMKRR